jgi:hypothetical protein
MECCQRAGAIANFKFMGDCGEAKYLAPGNLGIITLRAGKIVKSIRDCRFMAQNFREFLLTALGDLLSSPLALRETSGTP